MQPKIKINPHFIFTAISKIESFAETHAHGLSRLFITLIALSSLGLISQFSHANPSTTFSQTILPVGGADTVTVTSPNGGETWYIGSVQNITWTSTGTVTDVKIELRRDPAGSWETITTQTPDDGTYPWQVTGSATTQATVRISKATDATVNDISDGTFTIAIAPNGDGQIITPITSVPQYPTIDNIYFESGSLVTDAPIPNSSDVPLVIEGSNYISGSTVSVGGSKVPTLFVDTHHLKIVIPKDFPVGDYPVSVKNPDGLASFWGNKLHITAPSAIVEPPLLTDYYRAKLIRRSPQKITINPGDTATVWAEFENTGTLPWHSDGATAVVIGTNGPENRTTPFAYDRWLTPTHPTAVQSPFGSAPYTIAPGSVGRFEFVLKAPAEVGLYHEPFGLLAEPNQWFWTDDLHWDIQVGKGQLPLRGITRTPISQTPGAPTSGTTPTITTVSRGNLFIQGLKFIAYNWYWLLFLILLIWWIRRELKKLPVVHA